MYAKGSAQYSHLSSDPSREGSKGIIVTQGGITVKNILLFLGVAAALMVVLAVVALALGIAGIKSANTVTPTASSTPTSPTSKPTSPTSKPTPQFVTKTECGSGQWKRIGFFNMSDPSQQCPRGWRGYDPSTTNGVRCCGRPVTDRSSCPSVFYGTNGYQYSKVCGRATGYQQGSPDGFASIVNAEPATETVNGIYVDGVSVTYGNPRTHIWTFAVGVHEKGTGNVNNHNNCPCDGGASPPPFVGNNYFCETGDDTPNVQLRRFYYEDPVWDGFGCDNTTCCLLNTPPWFKAQLSAPTTDDIEVRICGDQRTGDEDSPISLLEIYVQ